MKGANAWFSAPILSRFLLDGELKPAPKVASQRSRRPPSASSSLRHKLAGSFRVKSFPCGGHNYPKGLGHWSYGSVVETQKATSRHSYHVMSWILRSEPRSFPED